MSGPGRARLAKEAPARGGTSVALEGRMTRRLLVPVFTLAFGALGCDGSSPMDSPSPSATCTHDDCAVPISDIASACATTLAAATTSWCVNGVVATGPCGTLTHVSIKTIGPLEDCYYDTASGALVGGISRSDDGFTKRAGTIPTEDCPVTPVCGPL
jgi:hypothetical protein